jgi:hypothetical protein
MIFTDENLFVLVADPDSPLKVWNPKLRTPKNACIPQLRLFATELAFLSIAVPKCENPVIVYAGCAVGRHIPVLASLYPQLQFHLYDTRTCGFIADSQLILHREKFTNKTADFWKKSGRQLIFICDVRSMSYTDQRYEQHNQYDMENQAKWVQIMQPMWWSLKFRLPYFVVEKDEPYKYLTGWLMLQPFARALSMEMRLFGNSGHMTTYNPRRLEQLMFYHNTEVRPVRDAFCNVYSLDDKKYAEPGFNHGYDIAYLLYVIDKYQTGSCAVPTVRNFTEEQNIIFVKTLIENISQKEWSLVDYKNASRHS